MSKRLIPQKKAKEIYFAFLNAGKGMISDFLAKRCAMIAVEELIESAPFETGGVNCEWSYWITVKRELIDLK